VRDLNDELAHFARAIIHGEELSSKINLNYSNYSGATAIEVYRNNYRGNLHDALAGAYPVIKQLVGDDFFRFMARKFIEQYPSRSANLYHYGVELADFVAIFTPAQELVYLSDVAALEWACHVAYFVADAAPLALDKLALIPPEQYSNLILCTHPACRIVRSRYPVAAIWRAHQSGADSDFRVSLESGSSIALVSRKEVAVQISELSEADADWLQRIQAGSSLGVATSATLERYPDFDLQATLLKLVAQTVLIDFNLGTST
jgi:hypothetical protein